MANQNWSTSLIARSAKKPNLEFALLLKQLKVLMAVKRTTTAPADGRLAYLPLRLSGAVRARCRDLELYHAS